MTDMSKDQGVLVALVKRFEEQRLPRALDIKKRVDAGEVLTTDDIEFIEHVQTEARGILPMVERHPDWHELFGKAIHLYKEIMDKAVENEKAGGR